MVLSGAVHGPGPKKRASPCTSPEDYAGWGAPPPMVVPRQGLNPIPFSHYAIIYMDNMGKVGVAESPSIRVGAQSFFTPELRQKFVEVVGGKMSYQRPVPGRPMDLSRHPGLKDDVVLTNGGLPFEYDSKLRHYEGEPGLYPDQWHTIRQAKRRKGCAGGPTLEFQYVDQIPCCPPEEVPVYPTSDRTALEIGDTEKVVAYYEMALKHFQQLNCRQMAKAFIKFIEPRKQVKHPYNGGRPPPGAPPGEKGDPEKTKPEWWPEGVVHKEPDHLKKDQRLRLLIHIFRKLGKYGITAEKLREVAHDSKRQIKPPERIEILDEIFRVRKLEERFERGEVDATAVVHVVNRDPNIKLDKDSDTFSEPDPQSDHADAADAEEGLMAPGLSAEQAAAPLTSPVVAQQGRAMRMADDRSQLFRIPSSLGFDEQSRQSHPFHSPPHGMKADYPDDFSSPTMVRPAVSTVVTPNEHPTGFEYLAQTPFTSSASEEQIRQQHSPTHFDTWSPSFQPTLFNPVDYGAGSGQAIPQQPMQFHVPLMSTPHSHEVSPHQTPTGHPLPDLHGARAQAHLEAMPMNPPPFRTGSLSHPHVVPPSC
ncbi:hypothetical protein VTN02DRAFT_2808 [Thermoascus thermophilus]